jgi:hypothetical protein
MILGAATLAGAAQAKTPRATATRVKTALPPQSLSDLLAAGRCALASSQRGA